jgi:lipoate---protein ligase
MTQAWGVERFRGTPTECFVGPSASASLLHNGLSGPLLRFINVDRPVLVLGSSQNDSIVGNVPAVIKRRTGGGAVWLDPAEQVWVDILIPRDHPEWEEDVTKSFMWLGQRWAEIVRALGVSEPLRVHMGGLVQSVWSPLLCFAGQGPGEVFTHQRKLVGIAQRRGRGGALFQCGLLRAWTFDPTWFAESVKPGDASLAQRAGVGLKDLGHNVERSAIEAAIVSGLTT